MEHPIVRALRAHLLEIDREWASGQSRTVVIKLEEARECLRVAIEAEAKEAK